MMGGGAVSPHISLQPQRLLHGCAEPDLQRARRVGEFRESDDWSPLLLLRRWALEHDSEEGEGLSGSSILG